MGEEEGAQNNARTMSVVVSAKKNIIQSETYRGGGDTWELVPGERVAGGGNQIIVRNRRTNGRAHAEVNADYTLSIGTSTTGPITLTKAL